VKINEVYRLLIGAYIDWSHILANPQYVRIDARDGPHISWNNRTPRMLKHPVLASDITYLADNGQYTFQILEDGSIIQIYYKYDAKGNELRSARLAFYSAKTDAFVIGTNERIFSSTDGEATERSEDEDDLNNISEFIEYTARPSTLIDGSVSWLRIEYEPKDAKGILHHDCHMHFSAFPYSRFVVAGVPTPVQFIEFVMAFCYPEIYKEHRLNAQGNYVNEEKITAINSTCFPMTESIVFSQIAHFRIPIVSKGRQR
jgi:hypothetical protein